MKKWILAPLAALALSGCGSIAGVLNPNLDRAYLVNTESFGYQATVELRVDDEGNVSGEVVRFASTPNMTFELLIRAGAPDLFNLRYIATLIDYRGLPVFAISEDMPSVADSRQQLRGNVATLIGGGYFCPEISNATCPVQQREFVDRTQTFTRSMNSVSWSKEYKDSNVVHQYMMQVRFEGEAAGRPVSWTQQYPVSLRDLRR